MKNTELESGMRFKTNTIDRYGDECILEIKLNRKLLEEEPKKCVKLYKPVKISFRGEKSMQLINIISIKKALELIKSGHWTPI